MVVLSIGRVLPITEKIHQNQDVWSLRGAVYPQSYTLQRRSESVGEE